MHFKTNKIVPLAAVRAHPKNYKIHTNADIVRLAASLKRFGQVRSIVCQEQDDERYLLVAGHGVVEAALYLQWDELRADILPKNWSPREVEAYLVADNRLHNEQNVDQTMFLQLLREQNEAGFDLNALGSSEQELQTLLASIPKTVEALPEMVRPAVTPSYLSVISEEQEDEDDGEEAPLAPYLPRVVEDIPPPVYRGVPSKNREQFENGLIRQIVLICSPSEFAWMVSGLREVRAREELKANPDVLAFFLARYLEEQGIDLGMENPYREGAYGRSLH